MFSSSTYSFYIPFLETQISRLSSAVIVAEALVVVEHAFHSQHQLVDFRPVEPLRSVLRIGLRLHSCWRRYACLPVGRHRSHRILRRQRGSLELRIAGISADFTHTERLRRARRLSRCRRWRCIGWRSRQRRSHGLGGLGRWWRRGLRRPSSSASRREIAASKARAARHRSAARIRSRRASAASVLTTAACRARSSGTSSSRMAALADCSGARHSGHLSRPGLRRFDSAYSQAAHSPWPHGGAVVAPPRAHTAHMAAGATPHATRCDAQSSRWHRAPQ